MIIKKSRQNSSVINRDKFAFFRCFQSIHLQDVSNFKYIVLNFGFTKLRFCLQNYEVNLPKVSKLTESFQSDCQNDEGIFDKGQ